MKPGTRFPQNRMGVQKYNTNTKVQECIEPTLLVHERERPWGLRSIAADSQKSCELPRPPNEHSLGPGATMGLEEHRSGFPKELRITPSS